MLLVPVERSPSVHRPMPLALSLEAPPIFQAQRTTRKVTKITHEGLITRIPAIAVGRAAHVVVETDRVDVLTKH